MKARQPVRRALQSLLGVDHAARREPILTAPVHAKFEQLGRRPHGTHHRIELRSEEHTSELQSLMRNSYAVFCLKQKNKYTNKLNIRKNTNDTHSHIKTTRISN